MGSTTSTPSSGQTESGPATCPVDHRTRELWLQQNQGAPHPSPHSDNPSGSTEDGAREKLQRPLSSDREISSIPRAQNFGGDTDQPTLSAPYSPSYATSAAASHGSPSNAEAETGHDQSTGNWVYPSEKQFFEALMKKGNTPQSASSPKDLATSVASIIPIHNAVNERAWKQILDWESRAPRSDPGSKKCGGPRLYAFRGLGVEPQFLSPRARLNGFLGYQRPFDRHDWVVERCGGERVEYVIDFYQGKSSKESTGEHGLAANVRPGKLNFYLDVRPKLNTWEGVRMRLFQFIGS